MPVPLVSAGLAAVGKLILPKVGNLLKGKMTNTGVALIAAGVGVDAVQGHNVFDSLKVVVTLAEQAWPHLVVVAGALMAMAGWFRKAGWAAASEPKQ
jgi:hypothetical protein